MLFQTFLLILLVMVSVAFWGYTEVAKMAPFGKMIAKWIITMASWFGVGLCLQEPGVRRREMDWKYEVFLLTREIAVRENNATESMLMRRVYARLRPRIVAYGWPDPVILEEIAPMFECSEGLDENVKTLEDFEKSCFRDAWVQERCY